MLIVVGLLRQREILASGSTGSDKPLESMTDELGRVPATRVLLATPPAEQSYWRERDLLVKPRALTELPIAHAIVAFDRPEHSPAHQTVPSGTARSVSPEPRSAR